MTSWIPNHWYRLLEVGAQLDFPVLVRGLVMFLPDFQQRRQRYLCMLLSEQCSLLLAQVVETLLDSRVDRPLADVRFFAL
jgi:hypothetical protein